jgi:hypothetical protein
MRARGDRGGRPGGKPGRPAGIRNGRKRKVGGGKRR